MPIQYHPKSEYIKHYMFNSVRVDMKWGITDVFGFTITDIDFPDILKVCSEAVDSNCRLRDDCKDFSSGKDLTNILIQLQYALEKDGNKVHGAGLVNYPFTVMTIEDFPDTEVDKKYVANEIFNQVVRAAKFHLENYQMEDIRLRKFNEDYEACQMARVEAGDLEMTGGGLKVVYKNE